MSLIKTAGWAVFVVLTVAGCSNKGDTVPCGACTTGCCATLVEYDGQCMSGRQNDQCGVGGVACVTCPVGHTCQPLDGGGGTCLRPDGGP